MRPKGFLVRFLGWSVLVAGVYYLSADAYAAIILRGAELLTDGVVPIHLQAHRQGFVVVSPEAQRPMGLPYSLFLTGLNVIFAPALVLSTVGTTWSGGLRAVLSVLVMIFLHSVKIMTVVLFNASHPENQLFALGFSDHMVGAIAWIYQFLDRMAYAFFPFLAWVIVCPDVLAQHFPMQRGAQTEGDAS